MNKLISLFKRSEKFWIATGIRCARTFLTSILIVFTPGVLLTDIDWKFLLISACSETIVIFLLCLKMGLPEVDEP